MTYPIWLAGDFEGVSISVSSPVFLRDVGCGVLVGSAGAERLTDLVPETTPVVQLYEGLPRLGNLYDPETGLAVGNRALRRPMYDGDRIPAAMLDEIARWCEGRPLVLVQCQAGLSRSAGVGYALLRARGVDHAEALRRVSLTIDHHDRPQRWPRRETIASAVEWAAGRFGR